MDRRAISPQAVPVPFPSPSLGATRTSHSRFKGQQTGFLVPVQCLTFFSHFYPPNSGSGFLFDPDNNNKNPVACQRLPPPLT